MKLQQIDSLRGRRLPTSQCRGNARTTCSRASRAPGLRRWPSRAPTSYLSPGNFRRNWRAVRVVELRPQSCCMNWKIAVAVSWLSWASAAPHWHMHRMHMHTMPCRFLRTWTPCPETTWASMAPDFCLDAIEPAASWPLPSGLLCSHVSELTAVHGRSPATRPGTTCGTAFVPGLLYRYLLRVLKDLMRSAHTVCLHCLCWRLPTCEGLIFWRGKRQLDLRDSRPDVDALWCFHVTNTKKPVTKFQYIDPTEVLHFGLPVQHFLDKSKLLSPKWPLRLRQQTASKTKAFLSRSCTSGTVTWRTWCAMPTVHGRWHHLNVETIRDCVRLSGARYMLHAGWPDIMSCSEHWGWLCDSRQPRLMRGTANKLQICSALELVSALCAACRPWLPDRCLHSSRGCTRWGRTIFPATCTPKHIQQTLQHHYSSSCCCELTRPAAGSCSKQCLRRPDVWPCGVDDTAILPHIHTSPVQQAAWMWRACLWTTAMLQHWSLHDHVHARAVQPAHMAATSLIRFKKKTQQLNSTMHTGLCLIDELAALSTSNKTTITSPDK